MARPSTDRLPAWRLAVFAALAIPLAGAGLPLAVYLPPYYAQDLGLGLGLVGLVFMLSRVWDAVTDPLVGVLSDRTRSRFGRRKPWIAAGSPLFAIATAAIFAPHLFGVKPDALWLSVWLVVFYIGWTMIQIPVSAWAGQLAAQYHERSRVQTYFQVATAAGLLLVLILPAVLDQLGAKAGRPADAELKVAVMGGFILVTFVPAILGALLLVREPPAPPLRREQTSLRRDLTLAARDPLLLKVLTSDFAVTLGQLIRSSLFVFFVSA